MQNSLYNFSQMIGCGGCGRVTTLSSQHTCLQCGRMLCGECGEWCKDHLSDKVVRGSDEDKLYYPEFYLNKKDGSLLFINWKSNRPVGLEWKKISEKAYRDIYNGWRNKPPKVTLESDEEII